MKKTLLLVFGLMSSMIYSQSIVVNDPAAPETAYTAEELLNEVLISGQGCGQVDLTILQENPAGVTNINQRSWGYFDATGTNFPFQSGIILSSGYAVSAQGPNDQPGISDSGTGGTWGGDPDLQAILDAQSSTTVVTENATIFQFTFQPEIAQLSFNFIFASDEYEMDQECVLGGNYRDGFAFLLSGPGIPDDSGTGFGGTNIASVPGSAGVPVSTLSIHANSFVCGSEVEGTNFFPDLYISNNGANNQNEIQYDGYTSGLVAMANLMSGEEYTLKMVIADRGDSGFDSAVFFEEGSFNLGVDLGGDITIAGGNTMCDGETITVGIVGGTSGTDTYQWFVENPVTGDFDELTGETDATLDVTLTGNYQIVVNDGGTSCAGSDEIFVEFAPQPVANAANNLLGCDDGTQMINFDLTTVEPEVLGMQTAADFVFSYHNNQAAAMSGNSPIATPTAYTSSGNSEEIFVRIEDTTGMCFDTTSFFIELLLVTANEPADLIQCDDGTQTAVFDLTDVAPEVLGGQAATDVVITYHNNQNDATSGDAPIAMPTAYVNTVVNEEIFVRVTDVDEFCVSTTSFLLVFAPVTAGPMTDVNLCDEDSNGTILVNLPALKDVEALGTQDPSGYTITYHNTAGDAATGINPLPSIYVVNGPSELIHLRVQSNTTATCFETANFTITVITPPPATTPTKYNICDDLPNDGFATFDLTTKDDEITGGNPDAAVSYYINFADAQSGMTPITPATAYVNDDIGYQVIYARVDNVNLAGCFNIVELELQVNDSPAITDPISDYFICDLDGDGLETFDLTSKEEEIINTLVDVTLTYHTSEADAEAGMAAITPEDAYVSSNAIIWVRVQNYEGGDITGMPLCSTVASFNLVLGQTPSFTALPEITTCDDEIADGIAEFDLDSNNATISNGVAGITVSYYETQANAEAAFSPYPSNYTNTNNPEDVWVRVENSATGCYGVFMSELRVVPRPIIVTPDDLVYCDEDNDGFGSFILTDADEQVVSGDPAGNFQVSYHLTMPDAINNVVPLPSPYDNEIAFDQEIFIRLTDLVTGCYSTTTVHLLVEESPQITDPDDLVICDDDADGFAIFDLTSSEPQMLTGLTGGPYVVSYFTDMAMTAAIANPTAFLNTVNPQTIYVTVRDVNNDCESETTLTLRVEIPPVLVSPTPLELCDVVDILGPDDGIEIFDLTSAIAEITGGNSAISITFFETLSDLEMNSNAIAPASAYQNTTPFVQTIYIRAEDVNTGCVVDDGSITLDLIVNPLPSPVTPTPLEACDINNDGFAEFTLTDKDIEIIGGEPGVGITYHDNENDAINGIFALTDPYANTVANTQIIFARATFVGPPPAPATGCFRVVELELIVNPTPVLPVTLDDIIVCDPEMDGLAIFDLTQNEEAIYGSQDPALFNLSYHTSLLDAEAGAPSIADPTMYTNTSNPQEIWVRLEDPETTCFKIGSFMIESVDGPVVIQPDPFNLCDDLGEPNDGFTSFDLTTQDAVITGGVVGVGVQYFITLEDAELNENPISPATAFVNTENPQVLFVRVTDGNTLCADTSITLTLRVLPNPSPEQPDPIILCDVAADQEEVFDLTIRESQILNGENYDLTYYETLAAAEIGDAMDVIADPTMYTNTSNPQTIYIRVTDPDSPLGCFEIVTLEISAVDFPDDSAVIEPYEICEVPFDGTAEFDLTTKIEEILIGQDMVNNQVTFYEDAADALAGINPIPNPTMYTNTSNPQTIFVGIGNTATGCYVGGTLSFEIVVLEGAEATTPAEPYVLCDTEGENDGFTIFDLSAAGVPDLYDEILGGQDPSNYTLTFHETLENAMDDVNSFTSYTNIINPQIIYARVENNATGCYEIVEVILKVEQLPIVTLPQGLRLCVDANGLPIAAKEGALSPPVIDTGLNPADYTFVWTIGGVEVVGETGPSIVALEGGDYAVTITQLDSGCSRTETTTVIVSQPPTTYDFSLVNGAFADNHTVVITAEGLSDNYVYSIDGGPFQESPEFTNVDPGPHTIIIKDANGCGQVEFTIGVVDYPDYFTPNGDRIHDTWQIIGIENFDPTANIYIFDRYGKLLKQISATGDGWDGTYNGNPLPSSDYWFRVEYTEEDVQKELRGHFALKR